MEKKILQNSILEKPYQPSKWLDVMKDYFGAKKFHQIPQPISLPSNEIAISAVELGSFYTADERIVGVYEVKLADHALIERNRVGLRNLFRSIIRYDIDAALIVYIQKQKWRFSYVSEIRTVDGKKETEPKRYTYLFGEGESCRTAADRFDKLKGHPIYLADLFEAFSVEKLNKDFFKNYKEFYEKFWKYLAANVQYNKLFSDLRYKDDEVQREKPIRDFVKKLLGRIVFLQFLQKKGWMGVPAASTEWKGGDIKFLQSLFADCKNKAVFHSTLLRTLFFETLNEKRNSDTAPESLGSNIKIPYLNGGLFEKDISYANDIDFPADYFEKLLDFFEQYNFTIDENDPYDSEVGIDPEMLGHIFENLLEDNREKGAFYTPKEIVHYMCQESLIEFLHTQLPQCTRADFEQLVVNNQVPSAFMVPRTANEINNKLKTVKICDPAIGSGAFPMGLLKEIFECRRLLYGYLRTNEPFDPALVKKEIIQRNIYGVDLENGAVEIARLRFWLALVVDEAEPQPLPNLDYKIMQGNSLLESFEGVDLSQVANSNLENIEPPKDLFGNIIASQLKITYTKTEIVSEIKKRLTIFFNLEDAELKEQYRREINDLVHQHIEYNIGLRKDQIERFISDLGKNLTEKQKKKLTEHKKQLANLEESIKKLEELETRNDKPFFLWKLYFADVFEDSGFDIVIGNPPYVQLQKDGGKLAKLFEHSGYKTFERTGDIYSLFYEKGTELLKPKGHLCFITSNKWMRAGYGESTRKFFAENTNPILLIDFAGQKIFDAATVDTNILLLSKQDNQQKTLACIVKEKVLNNLSVFVRQQGVECKFFGRESWTILSPIEQSIKRKIEAIGTPLKDWDINIYRGILTGYNEAFIVDGKTRERLINEDPRSAEIIRPILRGRDIKRYGYEYADLYLIATFPSLKIDIEQYPTVKQHLLSFGYNRLKQTGEPGARKKTGNKWFETQDSISYWDDFNRQKIIWIELADKGRFALDNNDNFITLNGTFIMIGSDLEYISCILNCPITSWHFNTYCISSGMGTNQWREQYVRELFIPNISRIEQQPLINQVNKILLLKKEGKSTSQAEEELNRMVYKIFGLNDEQIHFIESQ